MKKTLFTDVQTSFDECKSLNCTSEYECFLRRPKDNCLDPWCTHQPDCMLTIEEELISKYCYGWICPPGQKCVVRILDSCKGFNCTIERSCRASSVSASAGRSTNDEVVELSPARRTLVQPERESTRQEVERRTNTQTNYPIMGKKPPLPVTSTRRQSTRHTTTTKHRLEVSPTNQQIGTTKSNLIEPLEPSTTNEGKIFQSSTSPATLPIDGKTEPTTSHDTERSEMPRKIYITTDDALPPPIMLEDINFFEQGYPIWIKNDPYRTLEMKDKDGWIYHAPQEPYKILLPPYEPVILVEDARKQFLPFFTGAFFTDLFNGDTLLPLPEITSADIEELKTDNTPTIADDKTANYTNDSKIVEMENIKTNHSDDSPNDHANFQATEKAITISPSTGDKKLDNYYDEDEWRPWYMILDYSERNEPQSSHERESKSNVATDDLYKNDSDNATFKSHNSKTK
ncbi:uncharacterized protein LOC120360071 [Solenopsis invicta]|uniref:uncharacterized protein LOC120360071 n=1 Tax=Solenopsis invicta TaxID=13686 RepID=UPI00193D67AF|nr:uncharacterized protein LOC120360071 [Solenopsis invicta]